MKYHIYKICAISSILFLVFSTGYTQEHLKMYTSDLDSLWNDDIYPNKISQDGNWVTLNEIDHQKGNVLHLKHVKDSASFLFPKSVIQEFSNNSKWFAVIVPKQTLKLIALETGKISEFKGIESFVFSPSGKYLGALQKSSGIKKMFLLIDLNTLSVEKIENAEGFSWHPLLDRVVINTNKKSNSKLIEKTPNKNPRTIYTTSDGTLSTPLWSEKGNLFVFSETSSGESKTTVCGAQNTILQLSNRTVNTKFPGYNLDIKEISISGNEEYVFFYRQALEKDAKYNAAYEEWDTEDAWDFPRMKRYDMQKKQNLLTAWDLKKNELVEIATPQRPSVIFNRNLNYALIFNEWKNEPKYKEYPFLDIYAKYFKEGGLELVVENSYGRDNCISISPNGRYIVYFKDLNWWSYNTIDKSTINLTKTAKVPFYDKKGYTVYEPLKGPVWDTKNDVVLLESEFDVWQMSLDGKIKTKMTNGQESRTHYSIATDIFNHNDKVLKFWKNFYTYQIDIDRQILLEIKDENHGTGYSLWNPNNEIQKIVYGKKKYANPLANDHMDVLLVKSQKYNKPPAIYALDLKKPQKRLIFQTNKALLKYDLGRSEIIEYQSNKKEKLKGALLYPSGYDPEKEYPMVTLIYENISGNVNQFSKPSSYGPIGFNALKYVTNGYFVLYPDIDYEIGHPGKSALSCVTNAVTAALGHAAIDGNRLGLIGHSFGGYEAVFIATQTNLFRTAVAGSAVTDFVSRYHNMGWNFVKSDIWRYEGGQYRMGGSFYDRKQQYLENSTINFVENLDMPLLLWTGKNDVQVPWSQSVEFYLAMKRLNKKGKLIVFENEGHTLYKSHNQEYLSVKIFDWFEHYLKKKNGG